MSKAINMFYAATFVPIHTFSEKRRRVIPRALLSVRKHIILFSERT